MRIGGATLDKAIADHLHFRHKVLIGELTAERIKQAYTERAANAANDETIEVKGRSLVTRLPIAVALPLTELDQVADKHLQQIVVTIREVLGGTPPELSEDIHKHGIILTGGSATTPLLRAMIGADTGLAVTIADEPARCVARGLHQMLLA